MRLFISVALLLAAASAAPSTLTFTSPDSSKCLLQKKGQSVSSSCDLASCGTSTCQLKSRSTAQDKELAALRDFATNQAAENAALRKLIAALTTGLNSIKATHDTDHGEQSSALKDLEDAYIAADTQLQASIQTIALTPGKDGADGKDGAQGERGATGATGAQGAAGELPSTVNRWKVTPNVRCSGTRGEGQFFLEKAFSTMSLVGDQHDEKVAWCQQWCESHNDCVAFDIHTNAPAKGDCHLYRAADCTTTAASTKGIDMYRRPTAPVSPSPGPTPPNVQCYDEPRRGHADTEMKDGRNMKDEDPLWADQRTALFWCREHGFTEVASSSATDNYADGVKSCKLARNECGTCTHGVDWKRDGMCSRRFDQICCAKPTSAPTVAPTHAPTPAPTPAPTTCFQDMRRGHEGVDMKDARNMKNKDPLCPTEASALAWCREHGYTKVLSSSTTKKTTSCVYGLAKKWRGPQLWGAGAPPFTAESLAVSRASWEFQGWQRDGGIQKILDKVCCGAPKPVKPQGAGSVS
jgi:hypothetical protein